MRSWVLIFGWLILAHGCGTLQADTHDKVDAGFPIPETVYDAAAALRVAELGRSLSLFEVFALRVREDPFNLVATVVFFCAIVHTFLCAKFNRLGARFERRHQEALRQAGVRYPAGREPVCFRATMFHFLGEVEAVFGIWLIPLFLAMILSPLHGWGDAVAYVDSRNFTEPMFVVVIMAIASTRPVVQFAAGVLGGLARLGGGSPAAWWLAILTVAPLLGSFITEPAAMTIGAMLLSREFYRHAPPKQLCYATLGLLFVNVSVGGTLTHFAAPPVLMVAAEWHWNLPFMFTNFGWRAILGICLANLLYFAVFRRQLFALAATSGTAERESQSNPAVPAWVTAVHLCFLGWTVLTLHHPAFFVGGFLFFLAFVQATEHHQHEMSIRAPVLVGFFLGGLVVHGGLQAWWIAPVLSGLGEGQLFLTAAFLTAFNDNAAITFLASQVPAFSPEILVQGNLMTKEGAELLRAHAMEYAVVAGAVVGGGLTVIANAPNPAGQSLLKRHFGGSGVAPLGLLVAALPPTIIMALCFMAIPR